jgi:hypothetical protein
MTITEKQAIRILAPLIVAFPNSKAGDETILVYAKVLCCLSEAALTASVMKCMRTCKFFPSIAEIMDQAENMVQVATGTKHKSPDEAWNEVLKQMNEAYVYKEPEFSTPEIKHAALAMGWTGLCETLTKDMGTARAQFLKLYDSTCKRKQAEKIDNEVLGLVSGIEIKMIK